MKSGFYYTNLKQINSRKLLNLLFKHISPINGPNMAIISNLRLRCRECANHRKDFRVEVQKPKSGAAAKTYLFLFLGRPRTPTNVNDLFIQPYTPNHKDMHWNRLEQLVSLLDFFMGFGRIATPVRKNRNFMLFRPNQGTPWWVMIFET